ncbi:MAG: gliding motility-associated C-terminal domain-containing protein [Crocinitomicaceae bacterium]|nr:gliding motility-associated C-terminal domain-containing protein [Crocinitomicaceae bacterium]
MSDKDYIKDIFSEKLGDYKAKVNPELWNGIASQIGTAGATAATGITVFTKWMIGLGIASVVAVGVYFATIPGEDPANNEGQVAQSETVNEEPTRNDVTPSVEDIQNNEVINEGLTPDVLPQDLTDDSATNIVVEIIEDLEVELIPLREEEEDPNDASPSEEETIIDVVKIEAIEEETLPEEIPAEEPEVEEAVYSLGALPNVFTPNGDGRNDIFKIESENLTEFSIFILNDRNQTVYESTDPNFEWNGTINGMPAEEGRYVYCITAKEFASSDKPKRFSPLVIKR